MTSVRGSSGGKTRTTTAHGPTLDKKSFKANIVKPKLNSKSNPSSSSSSIAKLNGKAGYSGKRKLDEIEAEEVKKKQVNQEEEPEKRVMINSLLNAPEEIDFPRGGGTSLTQIEVREAQLEGSKEAMQDDEVVRATAVIEVQTSKAKRRKLERDTLGTVISERNALPKDAFRVEHLNYKRLIPSTKVLAQIVLIRPLELIVSLPNQLLGHIPITNITAEYTERLEGAHTGDSDVENESDVEDELHSGSNSIPGLDELFIVGDWLSCIVVESKSLVTSRLSSREGDENVRGSRRIQLSTEPEKLNEGVAKADLKTGFTLSASVVSVEDHGYILSLGLQSLTAFVAFKDAQKLQGRRLEIGQLVMCRIKEMNESGRTCTVTLGRGEIVGSSLGSATSITSILPSALVTALVTATLSSGLNVKFLGYFSGSIDLFHLNNSQNPIEDYKVGQKIKARVIWDSLGSGTSGGKKFALSLNKAVLTLDEARISTHDLVTGSKRLIEEFPIGRILERVKVSRIDDEWGLTCLITEGDVEATGFVHISRMTDDHLATVPKSGPWKVGSMHKARVIGFSAVDGLVQLSLQPSILEQSFLRVEDVRVGEIVKGVIKRLTDTAMFISISGNVDGAVWPVHYSDIALKHPEKKFKIGASIKARILSTEPSKNRVVLTLRRQLIMSELPIVTCPEEAIVGVVTHAMVTKIMEKGILVDFYNGIRALVPLGEAAEKFTNDLSSIFSVGKIILVRIISLEAGTSRIIASARQATSTTSQVTMISSIEIGDLVLGEVSALHESNLLILLQPSQAKALMSYSTLARHRKISIEALKLDLALGQSMDNLVVVSKNLAQGFVIVGMVPSKVSASDLNGREIVASTLTFESLKVGQVITGRICGKLPTGLLVQLSRGIRGRVCKTEISDDFDSISAKDVSVGVSISCTILALDIDNRRVELSLRDSRIKRSSPVKDPVVQNIEDLNPGQAIRGFVKNIANHGLFISISSTITARVQIKELFDEYVKDWQAQYVVGQLVAGRIMIVNKLQNQVELSLRKTSELKDSSVEISNLRKGQEVSGVVKRVEKYGAFIQIQGTNLSGLCHKSKVTDDISVAWTEFVHEGDTVRAIIIDINLETKKISLGLNRSLFKKEAVVDPELEQAENFTPGSDVEDSLEEDSDAEVLEVDQSVGQEFEEEEEEEEEGFENSSLDFVTVTASNVSTIATGLTFDWEGEDSIKPGTISSEDSDEDNSQLSPSAPDLSITKPKLHPSAVDLDAQVPTSISDFERLLLGSPNSSYLWIQFIAFYLGLHQVDEARKLVERALTSINFREEQEKLNIWVALLNLENTYGSPVSVEKVFKDAVQSNDGKTVYLKLIDIYERSSKFEAEEELFKKAIKKYGSSSKVWTLFAQFYLSRNKLTEARDLLPRALKALEKRKHVETISRFAQLEFKLGDAERGRTIFEGIMDNYPKRLDLWFVYVDMEVKQNNMNAVRGLFNRVLLQKLSSKKGKSLFKKWLGLEKEYGDISGVEVCKSKALAFVESI